jgi:phospholipid transport system substrate-binding protein
MMRVLLLVLTLGLGAATQNAAAANCPTESFIQDAGAAFMSAARAGSPGAFTGAASRYADLRSIAMFALGPYRKNLPKGRESEYLALSKKFMGEFMAQYANKFSGTSITVTSCAGNIVGTKLSTGQSLTFRLQGPHRIADVSVSGVWLAQTMKTKFTGVIRKNDGDVGALMSWLAN